MKSDKSDKPAEKTPPDKPHILLVDDDGGVRYMLESKFMNAGYTVTKAVNGLHAIQILQTGKKFDLMICDLKMKSKSGLEVIQFIQSSQMKIPIMILTAFPDREKIVAAAALGVRDVVVKPVRHNELLTMVKQKLEGEHGEAKAA